MALVVTAICENCQASQLDDGRILVAPERALICADKGHTFMEVEVQPQRQAPTGMLGSMPSQKECIANDQLNDHLFKVEENISRTQFTLETLDDRDRHWRSVIQEDFQRVIEAAEARRESLLADLESLVQNKQELLNGQLFEYTEHRDKCQETIDSIFERIQYSKRDYSRQEGIVQDSKETIAAFPELTPIPIEIAVECQTQPVVGTLDNFGAVLESSLGRLPTILIEDINRQTVKYRVIDPEDAHEEKMSVTSIKGLQVEIQASVYGGRSLGWDVAAITRVPVKSVEGTVQIDTRSLPPGDKAMIRARTIIVDAKQSTDPIRISSWSDVNEMTITTRARGGGGGGGGASVRSGPSGPPPFFLCMNPSTGSKFPCKPQQSDYVGFIKSQAIKKFKWDCSPEDIVLKVVEKTGSNNVVVDLATEESPNDVLATVWDKAAHMIHIFLQNDAPAPTGEPILDSAIPTRSEADIQWPKRLMIRIKPDASPDTKARPNPLKIEDRANPGGWIGAVQAKYCERFSLGGGEMRFFFVDESGARVKEIVTDADFLFVQETSDKLFVVGEQV